MGPIFNEKVSEKVRFMGLVNSTWDPLMCWKVIEKSNIMATIHERTLIRWLQFP